MRYSRQTLLKEFGPAGQAKLIAAKVLVIGAGGLGGPVLTYLAGAGVGTIGVVDYDQVDLSNLHRQIHFTTADVGQDKAIVAREKLLAINPEIEVVAHNVQLNSSNALEIIAAYDLVVDGSDNFPTRYLVNDACVLAGKPLVYGAIHQFEGQVSVFNYQEGPNYRDLFPVPPPPGQVPNCAEAGVLGVLPGIIGSMQANEALKIITGIGDSLSGKLLIYDAKEASIFNLKIKKNPENPLSGTHPSQFELIDYDFFCGIKKEMVIEEMEAPALKEWMNAKKEFAIIDVREPREFAGMNIGGKNIPLGQLLDQVDELPQDVPLVFVCLSGKRSATAIHRLREHMPADTRMINLKGGVLKWGR